MSTVTVQLDSKWIKIVRSPLYWIVATLQGVSVSFAPLFLYWSGKRDFFRGSEWIIVPVCFSVILLVGLFYMRLGAEVIRELRKSPQR
jgi:hypothetical protein